jgi:(p)ppGpp synthase/HD superfamily hydrolase
VSSIADANNDMMQQLREGLPYLTPREVSELQRALAVALRVHTDAAGTREAKKRVEHSVRVCLILGELDMDVDALLATVLAGTITPAEGPLGYVTSHIFKDILCLRPSKACAISAELCCGTRASTVSSFSY